MSYELRSAEALAGAFSCHDFFGLGIGFQRVRSMPFGGLFCLRLLRFWRRSGFGCGDMGWKAGWVFAAGAHGRGFCNGGRADLFPDGQNKNLS